MSKFTAISFMPLIVEIALPAINGYCTMDAAEKF